MDSSGSKGVYVIEPGEDFETKFVNALSFSKIGIIIVEEFIEKKGHQIGGDGFLVDGELVFRCFGDIHFSKTNPMLPCSVSVPTMHNASTVNKVHAEVQRLLTEVGMKMGGLNFDIMVDSDERVFILEIGARNGGNMIPELTKYCTGIDMVEYSIKTALGEDVSDLKMGVEKKYFSHFVIHSTKNGIVKSVNRSQKLDECLLYSHYNFSVGDTVNRFESSANRLGIMLLKYTDKNKMIDLIYNMDKHLHLEIE